jgi:hypothetical protein
MMDKTTITVAYGDGIGPEIMEATLSILQAAGARLDVECIEIGQSVYARGVTSGIEPGAWDSLRRTRVFVFLHWREGSPDMLGHLLSSTSTPDLQLTMITNRGVKVWPKGLPETFCTDHWRCRYMRSAEQSAILHADILTLLQRITAAGLDFIKCESLCNFDGEPGFTLGQGQ